MLTEHFIDNGLWTYEQTAVFLGSTDSDSISTRSIMRLCDKGELRRVYPLPKKPRIDPQSVAEYIERIVRNQYDDNAHGGGSAERGPKCQKSTHAKTHPTGGSNTNPQKESVLEQVLKSQKKRDTKK